VKKLLANAGVSGAVRRDLIGQLRGGPVTMEAIAERQAMATATLRRRLQDEGTTFSVLLEEVRRDLAFEYLRDRSVTLTEVAFLLGYGNVTSFTRAFQRWTGRSATSYRRSEGDLNDSLAAKSASEAAR